MVFVNTLLFITWHFETTSTPRKRERKILVPFLFMYVRLMVLELASLEKKKEEEDDFLFFQNSFSQLL